MYESFLHCVCVCVTPRRVYGTFSIELFVALFQIQYWLLILILWASMPIVFLYHSFFHTFISFVRCMWLYSNQCWFVCTILMHQFAEFFFFAAIHVIFIFLLLFLSLVFASDSQYYCLYDVEIDGKYIRQKEII